MIVLALLNADLDMIWQTLTPASHENIDTSLPVEVSTRLSVQV